MRKIYQIIYNPTINSLIRPVLKKLKKAGVEKVRKIPVSGTLKFKVNDKILRIKTNPTSFASKQIYWNGLDNFEYIPIFKGLISDVNRYIDVGANTGLYSTLGCIVNPNLKVLAMEPANGPFEFLKKNIRVNNLSTRIEALNIAASNKTGEAEFYEVSHNKYFYLEHNLGGVGNLAGKISHRTMTSNTVKTIRIDDLLENDYAGFAPELVKIDTEATEDMVLAGMSTTIEKYRPLVICETLFNKIEGKIESFFEGKDYAFYNHIGGNTLQKVDTIRREQDNGVRDCFIVPNEKEALIQKYL